MLPYREPVPDASIAMMERVLDKECVRRGLRPDSISGEKLTRVIMDTFLAGTTDEGELVVLVRNLKG
ncbi:hypothetical protein OIU34_37000 [Pararhizobium sp. BT-229]|uniref:hypothetical protein n=1 Tax=Pararhizobium sp. BT-229 TaxID=2986923 RepID=UPI0021F77827|nr:hypothetical protein [Pararhizobium sp. BT-229]MCV9967434.1 hypothetical protein [Pararhizobium sp. BT-229]